MNAYLHGYFLIQTFCKHLIESKLKRPDLRIESMTCTMDVFEKAMKSVGMLIYR